MLKLKGSIMKKLKLKLLILIIPTTLYSNSLKIEDNKNLAIIQNKIYKKKVNDTTNKYIKIIWISRSI